MDNKAKKSGGLLLFIYSITNLAIYEYYCTFSLFPFSPSTS